MPLYVIFLPESTGPTEEIHGVTYRPPIVDSDGHLQVDVAGPFTPTSAGSGQLTVDAAGAAEQLPSQACKAVTIAALPGNAGDIYLGASDVDDTNGRVLEPGDAVDVAIDNLNRLYIDADTTDDGISYLWVS